MGLVKLALVIRKLRALRKLTQEELAKRARVAPGYLAKLETGYASNPSAEVLQRLAKALKVKVGELLE